MGMPTLIGAGVGAVGSAITGQSPLKGALLGGATGGLFGGSESLLGQTELGKNLFSSAAGGYVPGAAVGGGLPASTVVDASGNIIGANLSRAGAATGAQIAGEGAAMAAAPNVMSTPNFLGGMGSSTFSDRALNTLSNAGSTVKDWAANNPGQALGAGLQGYQALNQPAPQLNLPVAPTAPITQRQAPSFGLGQDEKLLTRLSPSYGGLQVYGRGY
jgi:hypothetical protein